MQYVELSPDAVVIRFSPTRPDKVLSHARAAVRRTGRGLLSVFADVQRPNEDAASLHTRLLVAAELSRINPARNKRYYVCSHAAALLDRGFAFVKDGYEGEIPEHYSVDLGPHPADDEVTSFLEAFTTAEEWLP